MRIRWFAALAAVFLLGSAASAQPDNAKPTVEVRLRSVNDLLTKAEYVGVRVRRYRFYAFVIAAVFGAAGGVLLVVPTGLAAPTLAYWTHSGNLVFMLLLGGFGHFFGPVVGAFVFIFLQDQVMSVTEYWRFVFGAVLAAVVIFLPHGLMGLVARRVEG